LRFAFMHYPLPQHEHALPGARAVECAQTAGQFEPFLDVLYEKQDSLGIKPWRSYALDTGIQDVLAFNECVADTMSVSRIDSGVAIGNRLRVAGTPTVLINGWMYSASVRTHLRWRLADARGDGGDMATSALSGRWLRRALLMVLPLTVSTSLAAQDRKDIPRGFIAPASRVQLAQCHFFALTRRLTLDSSQVLLFKEAIAVSIGDAGRRSQSRAAGEARKKVRDSVLLGVVRSASDSSRLRGNIASERNWFYSGACNGKLP
jgi:hypothetical protein